MDIQVELLSILREKLPAELKGKTIIHLIEGATLEDLLQELGINRKVVISVNEVQIRDHSRKLVNGEKVMIFSSVGGG